MTTQESIERLLKPLPHRMKVSFALYCAQDCKDNLRKDDTASFKCLDLISKWLNDETSVTSLELHSAAYSAAYSAAHAASAANIAAHAAYSAAHAASAANAAHDSKLQTYQTYLKKMIKDLSKLEKLIYNIKDAV